MDPRPPDEAADPAPDRFGSPDAGAPPDAPPAPPPAPFAWAPSEAQSQPATGDPTAAGPAAAPPPVVWATEAPRAGARVVPGAPGFVFAGVPARIAAYTIDSIILGIVGAIIGGTIGLVLGEDPFAEDPFGPGQPFGLNEFVESVMTPATIVSSAVVLMIAIVYFAWSWTGPRRATPGQQILDIQVGHAVDGRNLTMGEAIVRVLALGYAFALVAIVPVAALYLISNGLSLLWTPLLVLTTLASPQRVGLHDRLVGSWVVQPADRTHDGLANGCVWILVLLIALSIVVALVALAALGAMVDEILSDVGRSI